MADGNRLAIPDFVPIELKELISSCWAERIDARPNFSKVKAALKSFVNSFKEDQKNVFQSKPQNN